MAFRTPHVLKVAFTTPHVLKVAFTTRGDPRRRRERDGEAHGPAPTMRPSPLCRTA
jgi:hypothetical protein